MISHNELIYFTLLFCFAAYVRLTKIIEERTALEKQREEALRKQLNNRGRELTYQYSDCSSVPSLTSDDFSDDENSPYDATYCISSDMPFSIPGKPINEKREHVAIHRFPARKNYKDALHQL